ncbi:MAG: hypothetical protein R2911_45295 [Caldilineaceae bacterium]
MDTEAAQQAVADALPYYCTPKFVVALEELPMTSRVSDKKRLMQMALEIDAANEQLKSETPMEMMEVLA